MENSIPPLIVSTWSLVVGALCMVIAFCIKPYWYPWKTVQPLDVQFYGCGKILSCCFIVMLGYGITFHILMWATHKSSISIVALYASARPLFTVILSFIINKENTGITFMAVMLLILVLSGLVASSYSKKKEKKARLDAKRQETKNRLEIDFKRMPMGPGVSYEQPPRYIKLT